MTVTSASEPDDPSGCSRARLMRLLVARRAEVNEALKVAEDASLAKRFEQMLPAARRELAGALEDHVSAGGDPARVVTSIERLVLLRLGAEGHFSLKPVTLDWLLQ